MATTLFVATKRAMIEATCELLHMWKQKGTPVKVILCDNGTENTALVKRAKSADWKLGIQFQFTSVHTHQFNALVEKFFETLYNRARATIIYANVPDSVKHLVCKYLILHLTHLFNPEIITKNDVQATRYKWWGLSLPKFVTYLRPWGEAGVVHIKSTSTGKLDDRGAKMMYIGASMHHSGDTYLMFFPLTSRIHKTRDVQFTQKMFYRQDSSTSSDQPHPLDTSFLNMHLIQDTVQPLVAPSPDTDSTATSMPSLTPRDDASIRTISTVDHDNEGGGMWGSLPFSVQFSDPHDPSLPASDPDDGWQGPVISSSEPHMPDLAIIDATNVLPGEAIDSEINQIPNEIDIVDADRRDTGSQKRRQLP